MMFDDGSTQIEFAPTAYDARAEDPAVLDENSAGAVIAAHDRGRAVRRTRTVSLIRTTTERDALLTFLDDLDGTAFEFTDDVGRVWDAQWLDDLDSAEEEIASDGDGWHRVTVRLRLDGVNSDAGLEAYGNTDVSQMSIQKSGASVLYFPIAYAPPLGRRDVATAYKAPHWGHLAVDADRYTARHALSARFSGLSRAFARALDDYYCDTIRGAVHPFSLVHFRDGTTSYRWTGGLAFSQEDGGTYSGGMELLEEV